MRSGVLLEWQRSGAEFPLRMAFPSRPQKHPGEKAQAVPGTLPCRGYGKGPDPAGMARSGDTPAGGYRNAAEYYQEASALRVAGQIRVPTLIVTAQDDPFIPFESFHHPAIVGNRSITLIARARRALPLYFTERRTRALLGGVARGEVLCRALGDRGVRPDTLRSWRVACPWNAHAGAKKTQVSGTKTIPSFSPSRGVVSFRAKCFALCTERNARRDLRPAAIRKRGR